MHFEAEAPARVDELDRKERLVRLPAHQAVLVPQPPSAVVSLVPVCGYTPLDELAVGRLDIAEQAIRATEQRARLDVARRREETPHTPLQTIVERRCVDRLGERVDGGVVRVLGCRAVELDLDDAR